ncbi:MAG: nucleoside-diphosphate kinase [Chthoniobacterales bacterium]|nr:nucleoside-diphosphate kinase [Chthoniobacterales bacterium]
MEQTTLLLLKPDCITRRLCGTVLERIEREGFQIVGCKMLQLTPSLLREHYAHIADKPFYPAVEKFMSSTPIIALAVRGPDAIERIREITGPTDSRQAPKGTIRGDFGKDKMLNIIHASDSPQAAQAEISRFFQPNEIFDIPQNIENF